MDIKLLETFRELGAAEERARISTRMSKLILDMEMDTKTLKEVLKIINNEPNF